MEFRRRYSVMLLSWPDGISSPVAKSCAGWDVGAWTAALLARTIARACRT